jgi:SPOR domain
MGAGEPRDIELERELDSLYRKVAGLDQPEDKRQKPIKTQPVQQKRHRFRTAGLGWGLAFALFFLGMVGFLWWGKEWLRPPVDTGIIVLTAEETKDQAVTPLPAEEKEKIHGEPSVADPRPGRYAIQIRAYPEDQKQNAMAFLEDLRKRAPDVSMETVFIAGRGVWHRVLLGNFSTTEEAADYQKKDRVAREHPYSFIQRKFGSGP